MKAADRKEAARRAIEAEADNMLLASGYLPSEREKLADLMLPPPGAAAKRLLTPLEFREVCNISESTYYRSRRDGRGPAVVHIRGSTKTVLIEAGEVEKWLEANVVREPQQPLPGVPELPPPRRRRLRRVVGTGATPGAKPSMYDPPKPAPKKLRRVV